MYIRQRWISGNRKIFRLTFPFDDTVYALLWKNSNWIDQCCNTGNIMHFIDRRMSRKLHYFLFYRDIIDDIFHRTSMPKIACKNTINKVMKVKQILLNSFFHEWIRLIHYSNRIRFDIQESNFSAIWFVSIIYVAETLKVLIVQSFHSEEFLKDLLNHQTNKKLEHSFP